VSLSAGNMMIRVKKVRVCGFSHELTLILRWPTFYFLRLMPRPAPFPPSLVGLERRWPFSNVSDY
jgi:hypothetical protein